MQILFGLLTYAFEVVKYYMGYAVFFKKTSGRKWLWISMSLLGGVYTSYLAATREFNDYYVLVYLYVVILMNVCMQEKWREKSKSYFILFLMCCCMDEFGGIFYDFAALNSNIEYYKSERIITGDIIAISIILLVILARKTLSQKRRQKMIQFLRKNMVYGIGIVALNLLFNVVVLEDVRQFVISENRQKMIIILCGTAYMSMGILGASVLYIRDNNVNMEETLHREQSLKNMQMHYYEALLDKEADTRKYRHDMNNHLLCLSQLTKNGDIDAIENYLQDMRGTMNLIGSNCYETGNNILNAITNYHIAMINDIANIKISGRFMSDTGIEDMKLCTVYGNLLQNAVEEICRSKENKEKPFIKITFHEGAKFGRIIIENSLSDEHSGREKSLKTEKKDKKNHGLGLQNVQKTVEEIGGNLEIEQKNDVFCVKFTFQIDR